MGGFEFGGGVMGSHQGVGINCGAMPACHERWDWLTMERHKGIARRGHPGSRSTHLPSLMNPRFPPTITIMTFTYYDYYHYTVNFFLV